MLKALLFFSLIAAGCGGDDDDTAADAASGADAATAQPDAATPDAATPDASTGIAGNTVSGRATYAGDQAGDLVVGLFHSLPPTGPPAAFARLSSVTFPAEFELTDVDEGTYQALVVFDIGGDDPTVPGEEDLQITTEPFEVTDEVGVWLDVEITE